MKRTFYKHRLYDIRCFEEISGFTHIAIQRKDRRPIVAGWNTLQAIKNEVAGPDCYAVEVFPDTSTLVNEENMRHLWVFPAGERLPLGPRWG